MSSTSLVVLAGRAAELIGPLPCRAENPQLWFSDLPAELEQAKAFCQECPLRGPCLAGAMERAEPCGVWGGEIFENGALTAHKRTRGRPRKNLSDRACAYPYRGQPPSAGRAAVSSLSVMHDEAEGAAGA